MCNEFISTRNGFNHKTSLFENEREIGNATCHYINRTWECYEYQTSMTRAVENAIADYEEILVENWKCENQKERIYKKQKAELFGNNARLLELENLKNVVKDNTPWLIR